MVNDVKIMQLVDGTLDPREQDEVVKAIKSDPKLQKLYNDYQDTKKFLYSLKEEFKKEEIPDYLKKKIEKFNQKKITNQNSFFLNFFNIFSIKYSAVAAAFALFFIGGFYTNVYVSNQKSEFASLKKETFEQKDQFRGTTTINFIQEFDADVFNTDVNSKLNKGKIGEKITIKLSANSNVEFILSESLNSTKNLNCKNLNFVKQVKMSGFERPRDAFLTVCFQNKKWEFTGLNFK